MQLSDFFAEHPRVAVAFSGGVDSAYLLYAAKTAGCDVHAYFIHSQFQPRFELEMCIRDSIYTAISLGHLFRRHRILAAFGAYIVLSIVESLLSEIIYGVFGTFTMLESDATITMQGAWIFHQIMFQMCIRDRYRASFLFLC